MKHEGNFLSAVFRHASDTPVVCLRGAQALLCIRDRYIFVISREEVTRGAEWGNGEGERGCKSYFADQRE